MVKLINIKNSYQFKLVFESKFEAHNFISNFFIQTETVKKYDYKTKSWSFETGIVKYLSNKENQIYLHKGFIQTIIKLFDEFSVKYVLDEELKDFISEKGIKILDKWFKHFNNHPKKHLNYHQYQIDTAIAIEKNRIGLLSLATGIGKGDIIASLVDSYLQQKSGNIIVISFTNLLLNEISLRLESLGVIDNLRIQYINPISYLKSKKCTEPNHLNWLNNVELVIVDEAHHIKTKGWQTFINDINPKYLYGFTGSSDIKNGNQINLDLIINHKLTKQTLKMFEYFGESLIHIDLQIPVHLIKVKTEIVKPETYKNFIDNNPTRLHQITNLTLQNDKFTSKLIEIINYYISQNGIVFIPEMTSISNGVLLSNRLNKAGIRTVYMSATIQTCPIGKVNLTLKDLKDLALKKAFRVLICNQVGIEGLDIPGINTVISLSNKAFNMFAQPLGRAARQDELTCVLIYDTHNKILNKQMETKEQHLKNRYVIKSIKNIDLKG